MQCSVSVFVVCVCVRACASARVRVCVHVHACAVQTASSANALWKTNSVSADGVSRQRSSSDPPAVHPPLPPLRVTSTSTFFLFLSRQWALWIWMAGGCLQQPRGETAPRSPAPRAHVLPGARRCLRGRGSPRPQPLQPPPPPPASPAWRPRGARSRPSSDSPRISAARPLFTSARGFLSSGRVALTRRHSHLDSNVSLHC